MEIVRTTLKPGDVVRLKSGSPNMTVESVVDEWGVLTAYCTWFDGKNIAKSKFPITTLTISK